MRDFADIFAEYEKSKNIDKDTIKRIMNDWLDKHDIEDKDLALHKDINIRKISHRNIPIDAKIDLHHLKKEEAIKQLHIFFDEAVEKKYRKVLIIHGKGNHSKKAAVLKYIVSSFLEKHPNAGRREHAKKKDGGSGATWVMLKGIE